MEPNVKSTAHNYDKLKSYPLGGLGFDYQPSDFDYVLLMEGLLLISKQSGIINPELDFFIL